MAQSLEDVLINGKPLRDWSIRDHNVALDTLGAHIYEPFDGVLVLGAGSTPYMLKIVEETEAGPVEREVVDGLACYSAVPFGHNDPVIVPAVQEFLGRMATIPRSISHTYLGPWLEKLREFTRMDMFLPKNAGTEAVEGAIKVIRKWGRTRGGPDGDGIAGTPVIVSAQKAFHGRALGSTSLMDDPPSREGLEPLLEGTVHVPFNDLAAMERAFEEHRGSVAGVVLEPIQAEAGVIVPEDDYLGGVQALAKEHNVLFVLDEIQTGYGRTGANFAWQRLGLERPDLIAIGKAMGGGLLPISCLCGRQDLMEVFVPHSEGSTFGGYPLAAFVGLLTIVEFERRGLAEQAKEKGAYLRAALEEVAGRYPDRVKEVRGRGMLIGVEVAEGVDGHELSVRMLRHGVYAKETHHTNLRIAPPIVIDRAGMDAIVQALAKSLEEMS